MIGLVSLPKRVMQVAVIATRVEALVVLFGVLRTQFGVETRMALAGTYLPHIVGI
jgi:hypothetical protein